MAKCIAFLLFLGLLWTRRSLLLISSRCIYELSSRESHEFLFFFFLIITKFIDIKKGTP